MNRRIAFRVRGRVQRVGFRWFATNAAEDCGVVGWVRNRNDGDVEGEAQGDAASLTQFIERLGHGPQWGRVDGVEVRDLDLRSPPESTFAIDRG